MKRPEQEIQKAIATALRQLEGLTGNFVFFHVPNGGKRGKVEAAIMKAMGVRAGVPDLVILPRGGVPLFIELKHIPKEGRKPSASKSQTEFAEHMERLGYDCRIVAATGTGDGVTKVLDVLRERGIIK